MRPTFSSCPAGWPEPSRRLPTRDSAWVRTSTPLDLDDLGVYRFTDPRRPASRGKRATPLGRRRARTLASHRSRRTGRLRWQARQRRRCLFRDRHGLTLPRSPVMRSPSRSSSGSNMTHSRPSTRIGRQGWGRDRRPRSRDLLNPSAVSASPTHPVERLASIGVRPSHRFVARMRPGGARRVRARYGSSLHRLPARPAP